MILSLVIIITYMALVGRSKLETDILYKMGSCGRPTVTDIFLIGPYHLIKGIIIDNIHYCYLCINTRQCKILSSTVVSAINRANQNEQSSKG